MPPNYWKSLYKTTNAIEAILKQCIGFVDTSQAHC